MTVNTTNANGKINITDESIALIAGKTASECYGVVCLVGKNLSNNFSEMFKKQPLSSGVRVLTVENHIQINLDAILKYGVSLNAVCEALKDSVKYKVEFFTGMIVDSVNVNVLGVRV